MKEEWLFPGAVVPVDVETTAVLVAEIRRLIDVVGGLILKQGPDYERGFIDGMQKQMQSSVDKAVNRLAQPEDKKCENCGEFGECCQLARGEQEPVANVVLRDGLPTLLANNQIKPTDERLYTTPPQRPWVGLTDEEENEYNYLGPDMHWVIQEIEAKLKDKNT